MANRRDYRARMRRKWADKAVERLVGRTITGVRYMTASECAGNFWGDHAALVLELDNGERIYPASDAEGNAPGALSTTFKDLGTIPPI